MKTILGIFLSIILIIYGLPSFGQVTEGLIGYFPFSDGSFADLTEYQDAVLSSNGDSTYNLIEDRFGNPNYAIDFQGAVLEAGYNSRDVTTEITISLWMKTTTTPEDVKFLIHKYYCVEPPLGYHVGFSGDSVFIGGRDNTSNGYMNSGWSETTVNDGEWHHIVGLVKAEGTWELWVNANKEGSTTYSPISGLNHSLCRMGIAGTDYIDETRIYNGVLDDIRIYNRALDSLEIDSLYREVNPFTGNIDYSIASFEVGVQPNPFANSITIKYSLKQTSSVRLGIFNQLGQLIYRRSEDQQQGEQLLQWDAQGLAEGIYYYQLNVGNHVTNGKMVKVR